MILTQATTTQDVKLDDACEYLLTIKGVWAGAQVALHIWNGEKSAYYPVDEGIFSESTRTEARVIAASGKMRLVVSGSGASTSLSAQFIRLKH